MSSLMMLLVMSAQAVETGERCSEEEWGDMDGVHECAPVYEDGVLQGEYFEGRILNARRGEAILSSGCGLIGGLLGAIGQQYTHTGIMIEDRYRVRHSTASQDRMLEFIEGDLFELGMPLEGIDPDALKYQWPGVISQDVGAAYEGATLLDPVSGEEFGFTAFSQFEPWCVTSDLPAAAVVKPRPPTTSDEEGGAELEAEVRAILDAAAAEAEAISGHYRFYAYTRGDVPDAAPDDLAWEEGRGTAGTVCSQLVYMAFSGIGAEVEGTFEAQDCDLDVWPASECDAGDAMEPQHDGLYDYSEAERLKAGMELQERLVKLVQDKISAKLGPEYVGAVDGLTGLTETVSNQILNCFAFDWCGEDDMPVDRDGNPVDCDGDDPTESQCWMDNPGMGRAIAPQDLIRWDSVETGGVYGDIEQLHYKPAGYETLFTWQVDPALGSIEGTVKMGDEGIAKASVDLVAAGWGVGTGQGGAFVIEGIAPGVYDGADSLVACIDNDDGTVLTASVPVTVVAGAQVDVGEIQLFQDTECAGPALDNHDAYRRISLSGSMTIKDHEWFSSDNADSYDLLSEAWTDPADYADKLLCVGSPEECPTTWTTIYSACQGDEVRGEVMVTTEVLVGGNLLVVAKLNMYEGSSWFFACDSFDHDGHKTASMLVAPGTTGVLSASLVNEDWLEDDRIDLELEVGNHLWEDLSDL